MQILNNVSGVVRRWVRALGPYVLVEIVLPGGTLLALLLLLYRRRAALKAVAALAGPSPIAAVGSIS